MDLKQIEKIMMAMERNRIRKFAIKRDGFEMELEKEGSYDSQQAYMSKLEQPIFTEFSQEKPLPTSLEPPASLKASEEDQGIFITSPMVGTFYSTPGPDHPAFVKIGDHINEDSLVCIIEAMKVMNEVKAGVKGIITKILLANGDPVQFGTKMFLVEPI
ncbi:Biotin carboxyl carrier protein of acetyl-CoA carboxylase [Candidatus Clavichlamydia salmonicola]|uniref:acetyl-CoA carboxylase biotin carboxyl carrier protein n=1 Tax=Candidatus Clavichlamydia salmonicola TaxID=469812 RepID=UPI0018918697|nr:acetyl-CoA carboxylase biotin carboxyl carrier protein [Candidatus Clavichlamydia salmonicola]MBF5051170.1 Biotin carboxyl carrier protein of acetyl-CoA carboxylase [Candidatus Clavichlamydia salmonicola]